MSGFLQLIVAGVLVFFFILPTTLIMLFCPSAVLLIMWVMGYGLFSIFLVAWVGTLFPADPSDDAS